MSVDVLLERQWDPPLSEAALLVLSASSSDCLALHRCVWQASLLSHDGRDLFCHFRCPDAESLRIAMPSAGSVSGRVWVGTIHDGAGCTGAALASVNVLVSRSFDEPVDFDELQSREDAARRCLQRHHVQFVRSYYSKDRTRLICLYRAPDAESVRVARHGATLRSCRSTSGILVVQPYRSHA